MASNAVKDTITISRMASIKKNGATKRKIGWFSFTQDMEIVGP